LEATGRRGSGPVIGEGVLPWISVTAAGLAVAGLATWPTGFLLAPLLVGMGQALVLARLCGCPRQRLRPWVCGTAVGGVRGFAAATVTGAVLVPQLEERAGPETGGQEQLVPLGITEAERAGKREHLGGRTP
jgi:hypothetical protein